MGSILRAPSSITAEEAALPRNGIAQRDSALKGTSSAILSPLTIGNGTVTLSHRIVLVPLTRNRGLPLDPDAPPTMPNRTWYPEDLVATYYAQRTTPGGLLISEGLPPSIQCNGMPCVPGIFHPKQIARWKEVLHGGNGYLPEQFLSSNTNMRTDEYRALGENKVAIRLTPFGLYNDTKGTQRLETWGFLCSELKRKHNLSHVHFIEPRYEQVYILETWRIENADLKLFRDIFRDTPFFSACGWSDKNIWGVLEKGTYDALAIGRLFLSTPDIIDRLKKGLPLNAYDRCRFYGPFSNRAVGYTDYPMYDDVGGSGKKLVIGST
ncbi:putative 12-oxophytodienoate reductase 4 [Rhexocercosporidium sp. MPI-PUGE-AT-0058]|nr:putative 12-oxophytodienoate reductase 4 [Rhexocercosporidium sp. MPI-PUGE-AT-0058]